MKPFTAVTVAILTIVAVVHLLRLVVGWEVTVSGFIVPVWWSAPGFIVVAGLAFCAKRAGEIFSEMTILATVAAATQRSLVFQRRDNHSGFLVGRSISSYDGTWVLSDQDSSATPQIVQTASPVCGTKNFSSVRLYSAPQLH